MACDVLRRRQAAPAASDPFRWLQEFRDRRKRAGRNRGIEVTGAGGAAREKWRSTLERINRCSLHGVDFDSRAATEGRSWTTEMKAESISPRVRCNWARVRSEIRADQDNVTFSNLHMAMRAGGDHRGRAMGAERIAPDAGDAEGGRPADVIMLVGVQVADEAGRRRRVEILPIKGTTRPGRRRVTFRSPTGSSTSCRF